MSAGEAATAVRSATAMLREGCAGSPSNYQGDHRNRSETLHAEILRLFGEWKDCASLIC
jgi:hypothetical protein